MNTSIINSSTAVVMIIIITTTVVIIAATMVIRIVMMNSIGKITMMTVSISSRTKTVSYCDELCYDVDYAY